MTSWDPGILFVLGIGMAGGTLGAWVFRRLRIPQVVGYIAIGVLLGRSGLGVVTEQDIDSFRLLNLFALGVIGFLVGGELTIATFRRYGKQFSGILVGEGMTACVLVGMASGVLVYGVTRDVTSAAAAGVVLGAIASATDPASTLETLREYRARGPLTTSLVATVALDDALAMSLYAIGTTLAGYLTAGSGTWTAAAGRIGLEVFGSLGLGTVAGLMLWLILRTAQGAERGLALAIGTLLVVIATAAAAEMDVILAAMAMGVALVNVAPKLSETLFGVVRSFASPIYVIFFVLVGARLGIEAMPGWLWLLVGAYVVLRSVGKAVGAYLGARMTGASASVRKYVGFGLFAQGGVAVGLSIMASHYFGQAEVAPGLSLGGLIIATVTTTTLIVQVIGPPMVKLAVRLADEIGRDVTEDDVRSTLCVRDVLSPHVKAVDQAAPLGRVLELFSENDQMVYPVVDGNGNLAGVLSLEHLKNLLPNQDTWEWLLAADVMDPASEALTASMPLADALQILTRLGVAQLPVTESETLRRPVGILDRRRADMLVSEEVLRRRKPRSSAA